MRGSLVPLAEYCGGCRELAAATPSPLRALPLCFGVPHRLQFTTRALITLRRLCIWRVAPMVGVAPLGAGGLPALSVPHAGPQLPAAPPGLCPESGSRATPSVFVGSRQPPVTRGTRHGRCVPRLLGQLLPKPACARTRPRFARPLPRFRGLAPRGSLAAVGSLSD